jgi:hypothetical protein
MRPRVHGNGFIQLEMTKRIRLHVWPGPGQELKKQKVHTGIHTHRFNFRSAVIKGEVLHKEFNFQFHRDGTHRLYSPTANERLAPTNKVGDLFLKRSTIITEGQEYTFAAGLFHETIANDSSITLMEKTDVFDIPVYVACPVDEEPDNIFDRDEDNPDRALWAMIFNAMTAKG